MTYRFLEEGTIAIHDDRWFVPPWGVNGGLPAKRSWKQLERINGDKSMLASKCDGIKVSPGDLLHFVTWGAGGWGDPLERPPELVGKEIMQGLVTSKGAIDYGVVADDAGVVDAKQTDALRAKIRASRGALPVFNRGPDIETLRATCLADTGLPAPIAPRWRNSLKSAA
jgi:N-methylhydantoinase B